MMSEYQTEKWKTYSLSACKFTILFDKRLWQPFEVTVILLLEKMPTLKILVICVSWILSFRIYLFFCPFIWKYWGF